MLSLQHLLILLISDLETHRQILGFKINTNKTKAMTYFDFYIYDGTSRQ